MASTGGKNLERQTSKQINFQTRNLLRVLDSGLTNNIKHFILIGLDFRKLENLNQKTGNRGSLPCGSKTTATYRQD